MTLDKAAVTVISDDQLWEQSRAGDPEAYRRIVERYQSLICSLAYSACGNLARSEDLAQETFVAAWQKLGELRDPSKLRAWLCGIVRNLAANASRREQRRGGRSESLDLLAEEVADEPDPAAQAVTQEEEMLLWRSLGALPETYREPMVLFYRQGQSVLDVANALELSEENVRQRLSRGRTMLREEMAALVESTLTRTRPSAVFTAGVLMALPVAPASAAGGALTAGAVASGQAGAVGKGLLAKAGLGVFIGPIIGLTCAYFGARAAASTARSGQERAHLLRHSRSIIIFCFVMSIGLAAVLSQAGKLYTPSAAGLVGGITAWTVALVGGILWVCHRMDRETMRIRIATKTTDAEYAPFLGAQGKALKLPRYFEAKTRLLGFPLFAMAWGGSSSDSRPSRAVCAWIAVGDIALSPFLACGGVAVAPIAVGAISVGILSLSIFWGAAFGVFALGSIAFGWWSLGCVAAGVKCAVGFAAVARDYAFGLATSAAITGAEAKNWLASEWPAEFLAAFTHHWPWWILGCAAFALFLRRRAPQPQGGN